MRTRKYRMIWLAWYRDGYADNPPTLIAVCDHRVTAEAVVARHKATRDARAEFMGLASWEVRKRMVTAMRGGKHRKRERTVDNDHNGSSANHCRLDGEAVRMSHG